MTAIDADAPAKAGPKEWAGLAVLALPVLLLALDLNVLHLAAPALSADLQPSSTQLLWILDVYGFMVAGFLVTMGTLGDRIGRRKLLLIGASAFAAASVIAAYAPTAEALIAARALLGVAGATLMPSTLGLISNMFPDPKQRATAIGVWIMSFVVGSAIGPIVGGLLLEHFWWGSVFLMAVPVMALLLATGPVLLPEHRDAAAGRLDFLSALQALVAMLLVVYAVKEFAKDGVEVLTGAALVVGLAVGALFLRRQKRLKDPLVDLKLFRNRGFGAALAVLLLVMAGMGGTMMLFVQYLQLVEGLTAFESGLWMLPAVAASILASILAPILAHKIKPATLIGGGLLVSGVGLACFTQVEATGSVVLLMVGSVFLFIGLTPVAVLGTDLVVGSAPKERSSSAASLSETSSELGSALSIALIGSVVTAVYTGQMAEAALADSVPEAARDNLAAAVTVAEHLPEGDAAAMLDAGREAFTSALNIGALAAAGVLAVAFALTVVGLRRVPKLGD
ncbi:MFS transporter [Glycomyces sp. NPDC046736]|uniref:MFS transporter n=1 Tax=Glycomyces sp. NPDC046736 TaxID=3155615 RepID=UPI0033CB602F